MVAKNPILSTDQIVAITGFEKSNVNETIDWLINESGSEAVARRFYARYLRELITGEGLMGLRGVGVRYGWPLYSNGFETIRDIERSSRTELMEVTGLKQRQIDRIIEIPGNREPNRFIPEDTRLARKHLGDIDIRRPEEPAPGSKHPSEDSVNHTADQAATERAENGVAQLPHDRERRAPEINDTLGGAYIAENYEMIIPDDAGVPYPNYVTELYESLQSHRSCLNYLLQGIENQTGSLTNIGYQYALTLGAIIGYGRPDVRYTGLGIQQEQRLEFNMQQYRKRFGDIKQNRNFHVLDVIGAEEDIPARYDGHLSQSVLRSYVRPVMPGTDRPIPFLPDTKQELLEAMRLLGTMPASPPLPTDPGHDHRRLPIASLYRSVLGDLPEEALVDVRQLDPKAPTVSGPVAEAAVLTEAEIDARLRESPLTHQFRRVKPPMDAPYEGRFPVLAMGRYDSSDPAFSTIYRFATGQDDTADEEFIRRLQDMMYRRVVDDEWSFDLITAVPGHEGGSKGGRLNRVIERATEKTDIIDAALLRRTETVTPQKELGREEREAAAVDPWASLEVLKLLDGERILLFDDICTSGSTMLGAAHLLEEAGAGFVVGLALALRGGMHDEVIRSRDRGLSEIISGVGR